MSRRKEIIKTREEKQKIESQKWFKKDQWIQELGLWEDREDCQTFNQTHQEKKINDPHK